MHPDRRSLIAALLVAAPCAAQQPDVIPARPRAGAPTVTLLDAGAAPRRVLRLAPRIGPARALDVTTRAATAQQVNGTPTAEQSMPSMIFSFDTAVTSVNAAGEIAFEATCSAVTVLDDPDVPGPVIDAMRAGSQTMVGLRAEGVLTDRALSRNVTVTAPAGLAPELGAHVPAIEDLMRQMAVPLPAAPVGTGAKWKVEETIDKNGVVVRQTTVYTLAGGSGNTIDLELALTQDADPQPVESSGLPAGATMKLVSLDSKGGGTGVVRLDQPFPARLVMTVTNDSTFELVWGTTRQQITQQVQMETKIAAR